MKRMIFDSHAHYDDEAFAGDRDELLHRLPEQGICNIVSMGADYDGCRGALELASRYTYIYAAVGIHPENVAGLPADYLSQLEEWAKNPKVVAIGEIGLDYHYDDMAPRDVQRKIFEDQILLAKSRNLPIVVHDREAHGDTMEILSRHKPRGVVHCFSGSVEMMREVVKLGMYIGLGGVVTFKNARVAVEVAREVPLDRLLTETDAPYLAPEPFRGKRCDSSMIQYVAQRIAEIRGITAEEVLLAGRRNAEELFNIISEG
ncbi:MAG: TatD family hydrolase [Clostridium sp.]|uniref:TatD family hydrolase n=1 Tax=Clostridium sp. TaxID=1506 RepID=UPI00290CD667|nr:TatD family hydrolase [Clostridium sp.]MDU7339062.1 TatD family hydrolase [Clostridium sp.]